MKTLITTLLGQLLPTSNRPPPPLITVTKILSKINLITVIGEVVGTDPDRVCEEGVREHDGGG